MRFPFRKTRQQVLREYLKENWEIIADEVLNGRNIHAQLNTLRDFSHKNSTDITKLTERVNELERKQ